LPHFSLFTPISGGKKGGKISENRQIDEQRIISVFSNLEYAEVFIIDRKSRCLSSNTISFHLKKSKGVFEILRNFSNLRYLRISRETQIKIYLMAGGKRI